jgi:hypothetical protein
MTEIVKKTIYDDEEFKFHEPYVLPAMKEIAIRKAFLLQHKNITEFFSEYVKWEPNTKALSDEFVEVLFTDYNNYNKSFFGVEYPKTEESIFWILNNSARINEKIETSLSFCIDEFLKYFETNKVSEEVKSAFLEVLK